MSVFWFNLIIKCHTLYFRRYCDAVALTYQAERIPEQIRLKVGGISPLQMSVYEEFARNIPGFLPLSERDSALFIPKPTVVMEPPPTHTTTSFQMSQSDDLVTLFEKLALEADQFIQATNGQGIYATMYDCMVLIRECLMFSMHNREIGSNIATIQKVRTVYISNKFICVLMFLLLR